MRKDLFSAVLSAALVLAPMGVALSAQDDLSGFTLEQLNAAIRSSGAGAQKIYSILTFDSEDRQGSNLAMLSSSRSGWHITVLHRVEGGLKVVWRSGNLPQDFNVSSSNSLKIEVVEDEQVVEFSGCAPHLCGDVNGVIGVLLYSPSSKQAFSAHYKYDDRKPLGNFGTLELSKNANEPGNERYKAALRKAMSEALRSEVP